MQATVALGAVYVHGLLGLPSKTPKYDLCLRDPKYAAVSENKQTKHFSSSSHSSRSSSRPLWQYYRSVAFLSKFATFHSPTYESVIKGVRWTANQWLSNVNQ